MMPSQLRAQNTFVSKCTEKNLPTTPHTVYKNKIFLLIFYLFSLPFIIICEPFVISTIQRIEK